MVSTNLFPLSDRSLCNVLFMLSVNYEIQLPILEQLAFTGVSVATSLVMSSPAARRSGGLTSETIVQRYSEEFATYLPKAPYNLSEDAIEFFTIHGIVDKEHSAMAAEAVAKIAMTDRDQELVWYTVQLQAKLKKAKFEGMYDAYA